MGETDTAVEFSLVREQGGDCEECEFLRFPDALPADQPLLVESQPFLSIPGSLIGRAGVQERPSAALPGKKTWVALLPLPDESVELLWPMVNRRDVKPGTALVGIRIAGSPVRLLRRGSPLTPLVLGEFQNKEELERLLRLINLSVVELPPVSEQDVAEAEQRILEGDTELKEMIKRSKADDAESGEHLQRLREIQGMLNQGRPTDEILDAIEEDLSRASPPR